MERVEWGFEALRGCVVAGICSVLLDFVFMFLSLGLLWALSVDFAEFSS